MKWLQRAVLALMLVLSGRAVLAQNSIRDLEPPTASTAPLTDIREAQRLYFLGLAQLPTANRTSVLVGLGLSQTEVLAVSSGVLSLKQQHDSNSSQYSAFAMGRSTADSDTTDYIGRDNDFLQDLQSRVVSNLSPTSRKALAAAIANQQQGMTVTTFVFEIASDIPESEAKENSPRLQAVSYHPGRTIHCSAQQIAQGAPFQILTVTQTVSGSESFNTTDGSHFTMSIVANGTYTVTFGGAYTCINPNPVAPTYYLQAKITQNSGAGNATAVGTSSYPFCGHTGQGPVTMGAATAVSSFQDPVGGPMGGTEEFDVVQMISGITKIMIAATKYYEFAYTWTTAVALEQIDPQGTYYWEVASWCSNGTPDWLPAIVQDKGPTKATDRFFVSGTFMVRASSTALWTPLSAPFGSYGFTIASYPGPQMTELCTHTGPQI